MKRDAFVVSSKAIGSALEAARALQRAGKLDAADRLYAQLLARDPRCAPAWIFRGDIALALKDYGRAASVLERAVQCAPRDAASFCNLGLAYLHLERLDDAAERLSKAIELDPRFAEAHLNLGIVLARQGQKGEAIAANEAALAIKPELEGCAVRLVQLLRSTGQLERAVASFKQSRKALPRSVDLLTAGGDALADIYRHDEAAVQFESALELSPSSAKVHAALGRVLADLGRIDEALAHLKEAMALEPDQPSHHGALVYLLPYSGASAQAIEAEARAFGRRHADPIAKLGPHHNLKDPQRRLRIGYVSADFRRHPETHFTLPLFAHHDRAQVEVRCYSSVQRPDGDTARLRELADSWCDISGLNDDSAARQIHEDEVDILVDLAMHSGYSRLLVFARKPAPVQVCWLAYPGTTGLEVMDYRLTDERLDPPGCFDQDYVERSIRLPDTFWCYDPMSDVPVNDLPALANGYVTFGCLNNFRKVNEKALRLWAEILKALPTSRLRMVAPIGMARAHVRKVMEHAGVDAARVAFVDYLPRQQYLQQYHQLDCCLDTFPYGGGTTTLDAAWMGVPVITLVGETVTGRSGKTIAGNLGLPELVAPTKAEYLLRATGLASRVDELAELRAGLRRRIERSPLMTAERFARDIEAAYRTMWTRWCE